MARERRAQARAALTPQTTGASDVNLIDVRLNRLKLEGTPRVKRDRRQHAPPMSPVPATADFSLSDFMIPQSGDGDFDYGTFAQRLMSDLQLAGGSPGEVDRAENDDLPRLGNEDDRTPQAPHNELLSDGGYIDLDEDGEDPGPREVLGEEESDEGDANETWLGRSPESPSPYPGSGALQLGEEPESPTPLIRVETIRDE